MPTLTPNTDNPLHGIIQHDDDGFVVLTEASTASPFAFCEEGAIASIKAHAEYLRAVADFMEKCAIDSGFDTTDWVEVEEEPETTPDVEVNQATAPHIPGTWEWAKWQMKLGHKVTRTVDGVDWYYFMDKSGEIMFADAEDSQSDPEQAWVSSHDTTATDWRIYEGTT